MKVRELSGEALSYWVARALGHPVKFIADQNTHVIKPYTLGETKVVGSSGNQYVQDLVVESKRWYNCVIPRRSKLVVLGWVFDAYNWDLVGSLLDNYDLVQWNGSYSNDTNPSHDKHCCSLAKDGGNIYAATGPSRLEAFLRAYLLHVYGNEVPTE